MVERSGTTTLRLDLTFGSLSNATRRDMLKRVATEQLSVSQLSGSYDLSFAAISKHIRVLEQAKLITKEKHGKLHLIRLAPVALLPAVDYLQEYKAMWEGRLDALEEYLKTLD